MPRNRAAEARNAKGRRHQEEKRKGEGGNFKATNPVDPRNDRHQEDRKQDQSRAEEERKLELAMKIFDLEKLIVDFDAIFKELVDEYDALHEANKRLVAYGALLREYADISRGSVSDDKNLHTQIVSYILVYAKSKKNLSVSEGEQRAFSNSFKGEKWNEFRSYLDSLFHPRPHPPFRPFPFLSKR